MSKRTMYACFAFFPNGEVKRWKYVTDLTSFMLFLSNKHSDWQYFNVYEKDTKKYLKRFYPGNFIPKTLAVLLISISFFLPARKNTFSKTTFTYGIYNSATIPILKKEGGALCS